MTIRLLHSSAQDLLEQLPVESAAFVHAAPLWPVRHRKRDPEAPKPLRTRDIVADLELAFEIARDDSYLATWSPIPAMFEWLPLGLDPWVGTTGGVWAKEGTSGSGYHCTGAAELVLLFRKGSPKPDKPMHNSWTAPRFAPGDKPVDALAALLELSTKPGDLVLDLFAGSGRMAIVAGSMDRHYVGCEPDPRWHEAALRNIADAGLRAATTLD